VFVSRFRKGAAYFRLFERSKESGKGCSSADSEKALHIFAFSKSAYSGPLAQLVEQLTFNQLVAGSNPARPTTESINATPCTYRWYEGGAVGCCVGAMRFIVKASSLWLIATIATPVSSSAGIDLHRMWDDRCFECHGHAGDFARKYLSVSGDTLQGRHHVDDLRRFLSNHYLANHEVDAVYDMLRAQASRQARFKSECSGCHGGAATFVRNSLDLHEGVVYSRDSSLPIRMFLEFHRNLTPTDVDFYVELLTRVAREIYRP
jgi:hypothetical protein